MENVKRNKKKKKSFLQTAKKFGKQGQRGKGTNIAQDQYDYLVRVLERWRDPFDADDERKIFVSNVFHQMDGHERAFSGNQLASRVIELLLPHADVSVLSKFTQEMAQDLRKLCTDQFSSHVLEKMMILCAFHKQSEEQSGLKNWLIKICKFLCNNFDEFSGNPYASHLLRTCIECITGVRIQDKNKSKQTEGYDEFTAFQFKGNEELDDCQDILSEKISRADAEMIENELTSATIQTYLKTMKVIEKKDRLKTVANYLLEQVFYPRADYFLESQALVRLLECVLEATSCLPDLFNQLTNKLFAGKLSNLAQHELANFVVQRFFEHVPNNEMFMTGFAEVLADFEKLIQKGYTGVILSVVKASVRLKCEQATILQNLGKALHCNDNLDEIAMTCIKMMPNDKLNEELPINLHGSLILQELLAFNKPIQIVRSLLNLEAHVLRKIFSDPRGSHIVNRFVSSTTIGEKSRDSLVKQLSGEYVSLACSKHGSYAVQKIWDAVNVKSKQFIVEELAKGEKILRNHQFGKFVFTSCAVSVFAHQRSEWNKTITKDEKDRDLFKDILGDVEPQKAKKNKKNKHKREEKDDENSVVEDKEALKTEPKEEEESITEPPKKKKKKKVASYLDEL